jgi:Zn-dependent M28 family amino/carboxypeptidase
MLVLLGILPVLFLAIWIFTIRMPGASFTGPLPPLSVPQRALAGELRAHVTALAGTIGERSRRRYAATQRTAAYIEHALRDLGFDIVVQEYDARGQRHRNIEVTIPGATRPTEIVLVGAHYDSAEEAPGADDNASGVAGLLALARVLRASPAARSIRFVAFATEEPPWFPTADMGSRHYADAARARGDSIVAMLAVESIGYFDVEPGSQKYPFPLNLAYPDRGDFIGFVANLRSSALLRRAIATFRTHTALPSQGAAAPWWVPGVWWSDQWPFWRQGYRAIMITGTAPYRNPFYHSPHDTPDKLDYGRMARVVDGLAAVVRDLAG